MRSSNLVRFVSAAAVVTALFTGVVAASAQDATAEPTVDLLTQRMVQAACPQGAASVMLSNMMMTMTETPPTAAATEAATTAATPEAAATAPATMMSLSCLFGEFSGTAEVPGPGASDAAGIAFVSVDPGSGEICYEVAVANLTLPAVKMHIHKAGAGQSGDVVVPFDTAPGADGRATGCTTADSTLANDIAANPANYYVNVHTSDYPNGAARAQLEVWDESAVSEYGSMMTPAPGAETTATPMAGTGASTTSGAGTSTPMPPSATESS